MKTKDMLQVLRDQSGKWFIKVLFVAIILSFMAWGIGDVIRGYNALRPVAKVGGVSLSYETFSSALQQAISQWQQVAKSRLTPEQIKGLDLPQKVLDQLIDKISLEEEVKHFNLGASDELVRNQIRSVPYFQREGQFSKDLFVDVLRQNHLSEKQFIEDVKQSLRTQQLIDPLAEGAGLPKDYCSLLFKILTEKKVFTFVSIPFSALSIKENPTEQELLSNYEANKDQYAIPELRQVTVVLLTPSALKWTVPVSAEEVQEEYERRSSELTHPEKRDVRRLIYPTRLLAEKAQGRLNVGRPMPAVARDVKGGNFEDLGSLEAKNLPEETSNVVFQLGVGKNSPILEMGLGFCIYQVIKIEPSRVPPLSEVRSQLEEDIRNRKMDDHRHQLRNKIEDALAAGDKLSEVAKSCRIKAEVVPHFSKKGLDVSGKPILKGLPSEVRTVLIDRAFSLGEGEESLGDNTDFVIQVEKIHPAFVPDFQTVRESVKKNWINEKRQKEAEKIAKTLAQESKGFANFVRLSSDKGLAVTSNCKLSRLDIGSEKNPLIAKFSSDFLNYIFQLKVGKAVYGFMKGGIAVAMLQKIEPYQVNTEKLGIFRENLKSISRKELLKFILQSFRSHYSVTINEDLFRQISNRE